MSRSWRGVFWDIGGVILDPASIKRGRELFVAGLSAKFDLDMTETLRIWDRELGEYFRGRENRTFRPAYRGYHRTAKAVVGERVSVDEWLPLVIQSAHVGFEPVDGVAETLATLADEGYYLGVISDIDAWEAEFILTSFGLRQYFDHVTTSSEVGRTKPAPEMFRTALSKSPVGPDEALYVGDRYENDMRGGHRAGLTTVAFGGTAASRASEEEGVVDFRLDDIRELLDVLDVG
ncbi:MULTISPECIES: HAD family hydrolase [Salinibaculum]|uniref:HAD family hydrolase n=1 Tax=Salinibaculum TaxID=2732368 RepID=UPI0030CE3D83